jgi:hypothetical protein
MRTMMVSIPEDKRQALLTDLVDNCGPTSGRQYFTLSEAAELLGVLVSMCRVCPWGIFLLQNLYHAMEKIQRSKLRRVWNRPEFTALIQEWDKYSPHPTDSSKYLFLAKKWPSSCMIHGPKCLMRRKYAKKLRSLQKFFRTQSPTAGNH